MPAGVDARLNPELLWKFGRLSATPGGRDSQEMGKTKGDAEDPAPRVFDPALGDPAETRLFERDAELQQLEVALGQLHLGVGGCILVRGGAGAGKTRLIEHAVASARATDLPVWHGHGGPTWRGEPLLALREALGGVEPSSSVPEGQAELVSEIETTAARVPHLLAIEDLQVADLASLTALGELAEHARQIPLLLLLAYRPELLPDLPPGFERATRIDLGGLSGDGTLAYAQHLLGAPAGPALGRALRDAAGPLHIWLWLRYLEDRRALVREGEAAELADPGERPPSLPALALARQRETIGDAFELMRLAAVMGRRFRLEDLAAMAAQPAATVAERLQPLLDAQGASREGHWWLIHWPGMLDNLYSGLKPPERARLHRTYGRLLRERDGPPVVVAEHLLAAAAAERDDGTDREAVAAARRGAEAVSTRVPETAADLLRRAADLLTPGDPERTDVVVRQLRAELAAGHVERARELGARELATVPPGPLRIPLQMTLLSAYELEAEDRLEDLAATLLAASDLDPEMRRTVLSRRALGRVAAGRIGEATADAQAVLTGARPAPGGRGAGPDESSWIATLALAWAASTRGDPEESLRLLRASPAPPPGAGTAGLARIPEGLALCALNRFDEALEVFNAGTRELERTGSMTGIQPWLLDGIAYAHYGEGAWDEALAEWEAALASTTRQVVPVSARARLMRAVIASHRGDYGPARELREEQRAAPDPDRAARPDELRLDAILFEGDGDLMAASRAAQEAWAAHEARGDRSQLPIALPWEVRYAREAGLPDPELARLVAPMADRLLALARQWSTDTVVGAANLARGVRDRNAAALAQAAQRYRASARASDRCIGLDVCGEELLRMGQRDLGIESLLTALDSYRTLGAEARANRVLARLRELGVRRGLRRPRVPPGVGWESLSQEELTVAALVSSGRSNPQIAEQMDLPRHRVAATVERVIAKLGVASRLELGLLVARRARDQELLQRRTHGEAEGEPE